jgi:hypothetical protein
MRYFEDEKYRKILLLPLRNFDASELDTLKSLFSPCVAVSGFQPQLEAALSELRKRQRPKTQRSSQATYLVDDQWRHFVYGKERYAQIETACPPHVPYCELAGKSRFGARYDERRHYNISM